LPGTTNNSESNSLPRADSPLLVDRRRGFAFVGSQVPLTVGEETFYLDLLFYHVRLHCYFVIELKTGKFKPEYAGKLNFYLQLLTASSEHDGTIRQSACSFARITKVR
jgi:YhcG PDDEXK nuclease domain